MSTDGNLRPLFRRNLPDFFWTTIESYTEPGIPDAYFCSGGVAGWIEFKKAEANKISSLTQAQVLWHAAHARKGGRSFFFVRRRRELLAYRGSQGEPLFIAGLALEPLWASPRVPWNWNQIRSVLLTS